jgi:hypothetical protein
MPRPTSFVSPVSTSGTTAISCVMITLLAPPTQWPMMPHGFGISLTHNFLFISTRLTRSHSLGNYGCSDRRPFLL